VSKNDTRAFLYFYNSIIVNLGLIYCEKGAEVFARSLLFPCWNANVPYTRNDGLIARAMASMCEAGSLFVEYGGGKVRI
jgi:hypothetical protein